MMTNDYLSNLRALAEAATPGPLEARLCPGMPTACVDYGVISHATGKETCRVWTENDARFIKEASPQTVLALLDLIKQKDEALGKIDRWFGEFPDTGYFWPDGTQMTYGYAFGSNGERDFMRNVARSALTESIG